MCTRGNFLGLSLMACHVTAGWVAPLVHIADSVKSASPSSVILTLMTPDGLTYGARCSHVVVYIVMLPWWDGYPLRCALPTP